MGRILGDLTTADWSEEPRQEGTRHIPVPRELLSPPTQKQKGQTLLWALTLASFLGGTYYGYLFRKTTAPTDPRLLVVDDGANLVARWDARATPLADLKQAKLRVRADGVERTLELDETALRRGEAVLDVEAQSAVEVGWKDVPGLTGEARFQVGDPIEPGLAKADAASLEQQIKDQLELNIEMGLRLATLKKANPQQ